MPIRSAAEPCPCRSEQAPRNKSQSWTLIRKTSLSSDRSDSTAVKQCRQSVTRSHRVATCVTHGSIMWPLGEAQRSRLKSVLTYATSDARSDPTSSRCQISRVLQPHGRSNAELFFSTDEMKPGWWSQTGSNRRPPACKAGALPTELWPLQVSEIRSQISGTRCCLMPDT